MDFPSALQFQAQLRVPAQVNTLTCKLASCLARPIEHDLKFLRDVSWCCAEETMQKKRIMVLQPRFRLVIRIVVGYL